MNNAYKFGILLIFMVMLVPVLVEDSDAKKVTKVGDARVFMQALVYNSDDQLVAYMENGPQAWHPDTFASWLKNAGATRTVITEDGKDYEVLHMKDGGNWDKMKNFGAWFFNFPVNGQMSSIIYFHVDSLVVQPGDRIEIYYTLIRPIK